MSYFKCITVFKGREHQNVRFFTNFINVYGFTLFLRFTSSTCVAARPSGLLFVYFFRARDVLVSKCLGKHSCMSSTFPIAISTMLGKHVNGQMLLDGVEVRRRWAEYFEQVVNVPDVKKKVKSSMARSLPVENLLPQNVGSIINYLQ